MIGTALVRPPGPRLAEALVTRRLRTPVDVDLARRQHERYVSVLAAHGWLPVEVEAADDCPDAVFVQDTVVVVDDLAVLARPAPPDRALEVAGTAAAVVALGLRTARIEPPGSLDGGDVLPVGDTVYVGRGERTNALGIRSLRALLAARGRRVVPVPLLGVLHLTSAVTALPDGTLVGLAAMIEGRGLPSLRVPPEETGAQVVPLGGDSVLLAASAPATAVWLTDLGFRVTAVDVGEFEKLGGGVTGLGVLVPRTRPGG